ncbi:MAG: hypothetical protein KDD35_01590 [Bdellovibrionales bacterium]|nr:hypothetical protein [Bdellovibrionales bacterium]
MSIALGPQSIENMVRLAHELESRALEEVNQKQEGRGFEFRSYHPWMSHCLNNLSDMDGSISSLVASDEELVRYSRALSMGNEPLGRLDGKARYFQICLPDTTSLSEFRHLFNEILKFNGRACPFFHNKYLSIVRQVVPIEAQDPINFPTRVNGSGFSNHHLRGLVFLSLPLSSPVQFLEGALNLAHEAGHQALMILQCCDDILAGPIGAPVYSVIRKTSRPAILSFHAAFATAYMIEWMMESWEFLSEISEPKDIRLRWKTLQDDLQAAIHIFLSQKFTPLGQLVFNELRQMHARSLSLRSGK